MTTTPRTGTTVYAEVDLDIRQGSECVWGLRYEERAVADDPATIIPNTFTSWSARSQIRANVGSEVWHQMTSGAGITLSVAANQLTLSGLIPHTVTEAPVWDARNTGAWDVELVRADGTVIPLAAGWVRITHDVTRTP